jgi:D-proline reductase (dithiol) PrdB
MPRIEDLTGVQRQGVLSFPCFDHDDSPFTLLTKPLNQVRLALVTTAGLHLRGDAPFGSGDQSYRVIPSATPTRDILQTHTSIGFDRTPFYRDINVTFPVDRLAELVERGVIAGVTQRFYSFMGAQTNPRTIAEETGPEVARLLLAEGADAALLTPT